MTTHAAATTCPCPACKLRQGRLIATLQKLAAETCLWRPYCTGVHTILILLFEDMPEEDQPVIRAAMNQYPMRISGFGTFYACRLNDQEILFMDASAQN